MFFVLKKTILHSRLGNIAGSAISSAVLWTNLGDGNSTGSNNTEGDDWYLTDEEVSMYCGVNDCPWNNISNPIAEEPEEKRVSSCGGTLPESNPSLWLAVVPARVYDRPTPPPMKACQKYPRSPTTRHSSWDYPESNTRHLGLFQKSAFTDSAVRIMP